MWSRNLGFSKQNLILRLEGFMSLTAPSGLTAHAVYLNNLCAEK
jgi:hypothetical protein